MGNNNHSFNDRKSQYTFVKLLSNGSVVKSSKQELYFLKEYTFTNQESYQQAFINYSQKLTQKHDHILSMQRTDTSLENTFCSTFFKITLLYEYLEHTLETQITRRWQERPFEETQVWSVLCSSILAASELVRRNGYCHSALQPKDIRLTSEGFVKLLPLQMVGLDSDHSLQQQGTPKMLALTILKCLTFQKITQSSQRYCKDLICTMQCSEDMKEILNFMIQSTTTFSQVQEYIYKMAEPQNLQQNISEMIKFPNDKQASQGFNLKCSINQILDYLTRDQQDGLQYLVEEPIAEQTPNPDDNDDQNQQNIQPSKLNSTRNKNQFQQYHMKSVEYSSIEKEKQPEQNNDKYLFTDPKLLNFIHSDLQLIRQRKQINNSRKIDKTFARSEKQQANFSFHSHSENQKNISDHYKGQDSIPTSMEIKKISQAQLLRRQHKKQYGFDSEKISCAIEPEELRKKIVEALSNANNILQNSLQDKRYLNVMEISDKNMKKQVSKQSSVVDKENNLKKTSKQNLDLESMFKSIPKQSIQFVNETYIKGRYEGTKINGMREGKGVFYYKEGGKFIGDWKENKMHGHGVLYYKSNAIAYDGQWKQDQLYGKGILYNEQVETSVATFNYRDWDELENNWTKFEGNFEADNKQGFGRLYLSNGDRYEGSFNEDKIWGEGTFYKNDGSKIQGLWIQNKLVKLL